MTAVHIIIMNIISVTYHQRCYHHHYRTLLMLYVKRYSGH